MRRAFAALMLVLPLAACGGTAGITSLDPLVKAADKTTSAAGAHFTLNGRITALGEEVAVTGTGEIADHGRKLHMRVALPMSSGPMEAVAAGGAYYVRGGPVESFAPGKWVRVKANDSNLDLDQADPAKLLDYLRSTSKVEKRGTATVRGVRTTHYVAHLQLKKPETTQVPLDVWIDDQGLVRRIRVVARQVSASMDLFDFGDVNVAVPAASETTDLSTMLGGG
jgi:hypothetical protein